MLISFIFSYLESFFVMFYLSFYFVLAQDGSARDGAPFVKGQVQRNSRDASATGNIILNYCPKDFDEILEVLELESRTTAASRA
jgi:hypothetical protein